MIKDYVLRMQDAEGRIVSVFINGACVIEAIETGLSESHAREEVETNSVDRAIRENQLNRNCWLIA